MTSEDKDQMVICEICLGAVHQSCYKGELRFEIPDQQWYCPRCSHLVQNPEINPIDVKCGLCSDLKGVMTKLLPNEYSITFVHPICVIWNPYIRYDNIFKKDSLKGDLSLSHHSECHLCK